MKLGPSLVSGFSVDVQRSVSDEDTLVTIDWQLLGSLLTVESQSQLMLMWSSLGTDDEMTSVDHDVLTVKCVISGIVKNQSRILQDDREELGS
jgi:hypothetical protein